MSKVNSWIISMTFVHATLCVGVFVGLYGQEGDAQSALDPSTAVILNAKVDGLNSNGNSGDTKSGRYIVRPKTIKKDKPPEVEAERPFPPKLKVETPPEPPKVAEPIAPEKTEQATTFQVPVPDPQEKEAQEDHGFFEKARDMVVGGSPDALDEYRNFLPPDDPRRNLIDLRVAPMFLYNDSTSPYWYRSYNNFGPGFSLGTDIWFSPLFALDASYRKTIAGSVKNSATSDTYVSAGHEWLTVGLKFRRFFGLGKDVPIFTFGIDYREYSFKVPSDETQRVRLKTSGVRLTAETKVPSSARFYWVYGLEIAPFNKHSEVATGTTLNSGTDSETFGFGLSAGGEYKLARTSRMFYRLSYYLERTLFSGSANRPDPISGLTPTSVPVNNSFTMFELGYIWGQ